MATPTPKITDREAYTALWHRLKNTELATHYGVSLATINQANNRFGLKRPEKTALITNRDEYTALWEKMDNLQLAAHYGVAESTITATNSRFGLHRVVGIDKNKLRELWPLHTAKEIAAILGVKIRRIQMVASELGLKRERPKKEKPAPKPRPRAAVGDEAVRKNGKHYHRWIMTKTGWMLLHHYNWLEAGNTLSKGQRIAFVDGNPQNCDVSNLRVRKEKKGKDPLWGKRAELHRQEKERKQQERAARKAEREKKQQEIKRQKEQQKAERMAEQQRKAQEAYQQMLAERQQCKVEKEKARQQEKERREAAKRQAQVEKQWQQSGRKNRKKEDSNRLSTIQRDYSQMPKVYVKEIRAWIYLREGQKPEDVIRKYSKQAA